jgi:predicted nuclease of predicted toxin-antitoxin system
MSQLRVLLDACVAPGVGSRLREAGADICHVLEVDPTMEDPEVIALAKRDDRLLVTFDRKLPLSSS